MEGCLLSSWPLSNDGDPFQVVTLSLGNAAIYVFIFELSAEKSNSNNSLTGEEQAHKGLGNNDRVIKQRAELKLNDLGNDNKKKSV